MNPAVWIDDPPVALRLPDLGGKTALVTGTSLGIGKATAALLLENGTHVIGLAREKGDLVHPNFCPLICDLSSGEEIASAFAKLSVETSQLDYVVNVAGIDPKCLLGDATFDLWDSILETNLRAYYFVIKFALPLLLCGAGRSVVNVSSINYRLGVPGRAAYSASKAGILGLTTGLSRELGRSGIRVNTVTPGWIFTERQVAEYFTGDASLKQLSYLAERQSLPLKIAPGDIANHILFYLSNVSRASTGHNCVADAGWLLE